MKKLAWIVVFLLGAMVGLSAGFVAKKFCLLQPSKGVLINIKNETAKTLKYVEVHYAGGSIYADKLAAGESFSGWVNPRGGEGSLDVAFGEAGGKEFYEEIDVSLGQNSTGTIELHVQTGGKLTFEADTSKASN